MISICGDPQIRQEHQKPLLRCRRLGRLRQVNTWNADGHEFFAEHRLLRYLTEPPAEQALTADDRHAVERLCTASCRSSLLMIRTRSPP
jgi:fructosamine-3-kinase